MEPDKFVSNVFGRVIKEPGNKWAFWHFVPTPIPRDLDLGRETVRLMSRADNSLGRLAGAGRLVKNPDVLVGPYLTREALASSRIEGTQASLSDVLQAQAVDDSSADEDIAEVLNYQRAMARGIKLLDSLPMCLRLVREVHCVLMTGVRGREKLPGQFRKTPVWIGGTRDSLENAPFVPPLPGAELDSALKDWEAFLNEVSTLPLLVRVALMHYQFETIHPFLDGNGRVGRLLIVLFLMHEKALSLPLLYVSAYMEESRLEYYERLQAIRERGQIQEWLQYFFEAMHVQATDSVNRIESLVDLREKYLHDLKGVRSRAREVVDLFFENPFVTVKRVERALNVTNQGARNLIESLEQRRWLKNIGPLGRGGRVYWSADAVYEIIS
jgi:Fic family protein